MMDQIEYIESNNIDPDVLFTNEEGPISPGMRDGWLEDHKEAVADSDVEFDNDTGFYNFTFRVPDEIAQSYIENKDHAREVYANHPETNLLFNSAGVYISGSVQTPKTVLGIKQIIAA